MDYSDFDRDSAIRTMIGEGASDGDPGLTGVGAVILNRANSGNFGDSLVGIVRARNQFTAWQTRPRELNGYSKKTDLYQRAGQIFDGLAKGKIADPTNGATFYYAPSEMPPGSPIPDFARTPMIAAIGHHRFYAGPEGPVGPDLLGSWNAAPKATPDTAAPDTPDLLGSWQAPATAPPATPTSMSGTVPAQPSTFTPQWIAQTAQANQAPGMANTAARAGLGALGGLADVGDTVANALVTGGAAGANALANAGLVSHETAAKVGSYAERIKGSVTQDEAAMNTAAARSPAFTVGRIGGQILGTAPAIAGAGAIAAPALAAAGPVAGSILGGAGAGGIAAGLTSAASDQPVGEQVGMGALTGGLMGPAGYGASVLGSGVRRAMFGGVTPETARLGDVARNVYGIPVTAGQMTSSRFGRFLDSALRELPFTGYGKNTAQQQLGLNRALASEMGVAADEITPDVLKTAQKAAYANYDAAKAQMPPLTVDQSFLQNLGQIRSNAVYSLGRKGAKQVGNLIDDEVLNKVQTGTLDPDVFQAITRHNGPLDSAINSRDSKISSYAGEIKNELESLVGRNNPHLKALKDDADYKYAIAKTIDDKAGSVLTPSGDVRAATLARALDNPFTSAGELGRIAGKFGREPPNSGTALREFINRGAGYGIGALGLGGVAAGANYFDPENFQRDLGVAGGALLLGRGASTGLRSNWLANAMIRGGLGTGTGQPFANLLSRAAPAVALATRPRITVGLPPPANSPPGQ